MRLLPDGGRGYERPDWDDEAQTRLTEAFFTSAFGSAVNAPEHRDLFESIL